jgi:hypothetical protein
VIARVAGDDACAVGQFADAPSVAREKVKVMSAR